MRRIAISLPLLLPSPALAEVCDKAVGDTWTPGDGPVWTLNPAGFPIGLTFLVVALVFVARARHGLLGFVTAAVAIAYASSIIFIDVIPYHDMYQMQVREGCRAVRTDVMQAALFILFALVYAWLGYRLSRNNA